MRTKIFNFEMYMMMYSYAMQMLMQMQEKMSLFCAPYVT